MLFAGIAALVLAGVVAVVFAAIEGWLPTTDHAFIEMAVRDIPSNPPLLGAWSRYGWSHPGPAHFFLLWPGYVLGGASSVGLIAAMVTLHVVAIIAAALIARRLHFAAGVAVFVALQVVLLAAGPDIWRDPWNPWVPLVAGGLLVVVAWDVAERRRLGGVVLLPLGTLLIQAHVGNAPTVVVVCGAALALMALPRSSADRPVPLAALAWGAAIAAIMWVPPAIAQLLGRPGRIGVLLSEMGGDGDRAGVSSAVTTLLGSYGPLPIWADPQSLGEGFLRTDPVVPVWLVLPIAGLVAARVAGDHVLARGIAVSLVGVVAAAASVAFVDQGQSGGVFPYLVVVVRPTAAVSVALGAAALIAALAPRPRQVALLGVGAVGVCLSIALGVVQPAASNPAPGLSVMGSSLAAAVLDAGFGDAEILLVEPDRYFAAEGVWLALERAGVSVVVDQDRMLTRVGERRFVERPGPRLDLIVTALGRGPDLEEEGWSVVATCRRLGDEERRRVSVLLEEQARLSERIEDLRSGDESSMDVAAIDAAQLDLLASIQDLADLRDGRAEGLVAIRAPVGQEELVRGVRTREVCWES